MLNVYASATKGSMAKPSFMHATATLDKIVQSNQATGYGLSCIRIDIGAATAADYHWLAHMYKGFEF